MISTIPNDDEVADAVHPAPLVSIKVIEVNHKLYTNIWAMMRRPRRPGPITTIGMGATTGAAVGWILGSTGHSVVAIALLAGCSILAAYIALIYERSIRVNAAVSSLVGETGHWIRYCLALFIIGCSISVYLAYGHNPGQHNYVSMVPAIVLCAALFKFGPGLVSVVAAIAGVDLVFGVPSAYQSFSEWAVIGSVLACSALGAVLAVGILVVLAMCDDALGE